MNEEQIRQQFTHEIQQRSAVKTFGLSKQQVNKFRNNLPTLGTMLELLFLAGKIKITSNGSEATKEPES